MVSSVVDVFGVVMTSVIENSVVVGPVVTTSPVMASAVTSVPAPLGFIQRVIIIFKSLKLTYLLHNGFLVVQSFPNYFLLFFGGP